ncbi:hypothetical protein DES49_0014 [Halospina denitrificans]|uniref:Soluble cytochrome b562 n=1 Tax=Halospina denitrificans TaxID=332522 RepID=A0A4R7K057_9GAMM|nr:DUF6746 family protein [Halospina denitrificans]TDT43915.1 hypothetical protein DES49_0014 [Halospina denitrificans]
MNVTIRYACLLSLLFGALSVSAEDQPQHFEGKDSETLEEAVENLEEASERMEELLEEDDLSGSEMGEIHRLTYTLEKAMARIREEAEIMAEDLERVHLGSEARDVEQVRRYGEKFVEKVEILTD